jgi:hypothetical protein
LLYNISGSFACWSIFGILRLLLFV